MVLTDTTMNCGGGRTPWNTWISCEERGGGEIFQVSPTGNGTRYPITLGEEGGAWESFAYDVRDLSQPRFFVTEDAERGALRVRSVEEIHISVISHEGFSSRFHLFVYPLSRTVALHTS